MGLSLLSTPSKSLQSMGNSLGCYANLFALQTNLPHDAMRGCPAPHLMLDRICDLNAKVLDYHFDFV